jgi:hypothetical protein
METETITFDSDGDVVLLLSELIEQPNAPDTSSVGESEKSRETDQQVAVPVLTKEYRMLVSSKHLMHISKPFKAMLRHDGFKEGHDLQNRGTTPVEVALPDDHVPAMRLLLDLIHHNYRKVRYTCKIKQNLRRT